MVTNEWYRLKVDIIEAEQCIKSWSITEVVNGSAAWGILAQKELQDGCGTDVSNDC